MLHAHGPLLCARPHAAQALSLPWKQHIIGVGLDSSELGNPPSKFKYVYERAIEEVGGAGPRPGGPARLL